MLAVSSNPHVAKVAQLAVYPLPTQQSSNEGRYLSSSSHNRDVFAGAGGTLYQLSKWATTTTECRVANILGLTTTTDRDWLVACFTNRTCAVYNTSNMSSTLGTMFQNELILAVGFSTIALFMAQLSGLSIIYIGIGDVVGGNNNRFELLL